MIIQSENRSQKSEVRILFLCLLFSVLCPFDCAQGRPMSSVPSASLRVGLYSSTNPATLRQAQGGEQRRTTDEFIQEAKKAIEGADPFMGDWQGSWRLNDGNDSGPLAAQVIALGKGKYRANFLEEFDKRIPPLAVLEGQSSRRVADELKDAAAQATARPSPGRVHLTGQGEHAGAWIIM